jgi:hypothetical protein
MPYSNPLVHCSEAVEGCFKKVVGDSRLCKPWRARSTTLERCKMEAKSDKAKKFNEVAVSAAALKIEL